MRVLLDARGHKIEELQCILSDLKDSSEREIRITKHQLLMMTGLVHVCTMHMCLHACMRACMHACVHEVGVTVL